MPNSLSIKEQLIHIATGAVIFIFLAVIAVALDLLAIWVGNIGVSEFTHKVLTFTAHGLLVLDVTLFVIYIIATSTKLIKEMVK